MKLKSAFALFLVFYSLSIFATPNPQTVYFNNAAQQEGDGSLLHPYRFGEDIPHAIKQAGENGTLSIDYGTGEPYLLPQTLALLPGQKIIGTGIKHPTLCGTIQLIYNNTLAHFNLLNKKNGGPNGIEGKDLKEITLDDLQIGTRDAQSSGAFPYGIYFDMSGAGTLHNHIRIVNSTVIAADAKSRPGTIGITIGEEYDDVAIENTTGEGIQVNSLPDVQTNVMGILSRGDHTTIVNCHGIATLTGAVSGEVTGLKIEGNFLSLSSSSGIANTALMGPSNDVFTIGVSYGNSEHALFNNLTAITNVKNGSVMNTSNAVQMILARDVTINNGSLRTTGIPGRALFLDSDSEITINGSNKSQGVIQVGNQKTNLATIRGFGDRIILHNGEKWEFPSR